MLSPSQTHGFSCRSPLGFNLHICPVNKLVLAQLLEGSAGRSTKRRRRASCSGKSVWRHCPDWLCGPGFHCGSSPLPHGASEPAVWDSSHLLMLEWDLKSRFTTKTMETFIRTSDWQHHNLEVYGGCLSAGHPCIFTSRESCLIQLCVCACVLLSPIVFFAHQKSNLSFLSNSSKNLRLIYTPPLQLWQLKILNNSYSCMPLVVIFQTTILQKASFFSYLFWS